MMTVIGEVRLASKQIKEEYNGRASTKSKGSKKKAVEIADEDSDASQASGKSTKKKPAKNTGKTKKERTVVKKKKKERKKSTGERCESLLQL